MTLFAQVAKAAGVPCRLAVLRRDREGREYIKAGKGGIFAASVSECGRHVEYVPQFFWRSGKRYEVCFVDSHVTYKEAPRCRS